MIASHFIKKQQNGQSLVEFVLMIPLFFIVLSGVNLYLNQTIKRTTEHAAYDSLLLSDSHFSLQERNATQWNSSKMDTGEYSSEILNQSVIIHHDNVCDLQIFNKHIKFIQSSEDIDTYISDNIINKELQSKEFDTIFIKDNLSSNYLELYGLRVAYHIRLSTELENKRFSPIVIISDFDEITLNRFTKEANILFTDGIYLCQNTKEDIL